MLLFVLTPGGRQEICARGGEDALGVSIFGVGQEFNDIRLDGKLCLSNEVLVECVEPPAARQRQKDQYA
jgi:hypothetical protein